MPRNMNSVSRIQVTGMAEDRLWVIGARACQFIINQSCRSRRLVSDDNTCATGLINDSLVDLILTHNFSIIIFSIHLPSSELGTERFQAVGWGRSTSGN